MDGARGSAFILKTPPFVAPRKGDTNGAFRRAVSPFALTAWFARRVGAAMLAVELADGGDARRRAPRSGGGGSGFHASKISTTRVVRARFNSLVRRNRRTPGIRLRSTARLARREPPQSGGTSQSCRQVSGRSSSRLPAASMACRRAPNNASGRPGDARNSGATVEQFAAMVRGQRRLFLMRSPWRYRW